MKLFTPQGLKNRPEGPLSDWCILIPEGSAMCGIQSACCPAPAMSSLWALQPLSAFLAKAFLSLVWFFLIYQSLVIDHVDNHKSVYMAN